MPPSQPLQTRSRETLERVLNAATELFLEQGQLGFTLPEVASRAGVSVGTVYRRFATKEDVLIAVLERIRQEERKSVTSAWDAIDWASMSVRDVTDRLVGDLSRIWKEQGALMRAMMLHRLVAGDDHAFEFSVDTMREGMDRLKMAVSRCRRPLAHEDFDSACEFTYRMIIGLSARRAARAVETQAPSELSWDEVIDQISDAVARYLFGSDYAAP